MKKIFTPIFTIAIILIIGLGIYRNTNVDYATIFSERAVLAENFEGLEPNSDIIVRATVRPNKENIIVKSPSGEDIILGYTITELKINEVFKGNISEDNIKITEEYYYLKDMSGKTVWSQGNYLPAKDGKEYIFFLKKYINDGRYDGMYYPVDLEKGKYIIGDIFKNDVSSKSALDNVDTMTEKELELINAEGLDEYKEWYKEVIKKYKK